MYYDFKRSSLFICPLVYQIKNKANANIYISQ
uniref:Uncharacterized protein n=1 Tax=Anguilla anguilla TaxID=7936 RepID=A0A0E9S4E6_ANGAN